MSWDELQLVPPTTSNLKVALQALFSQERDSPPWTTLSNENSEP